MSCFHCGEPVPPAADYVVTIDGVARPMCCRGCQAVAQAIVGGGLTDFYRHRTKASRTVEELVPAALREMEIYDRPELQRRFVAAVGEHQREASLILEGIVCAACVWLNERHVSALPGVLEFHVNYSTHRARVRWDDSRICLSDILAAITAIGYIAHPYDPGRQDEVYQRERKQAMARLAVAAVGMMQVMMYAVALYTGAYEGMDPEIQAFLRWVSFGMATPVVLYSARPFFTAAWRDLRRRQLGMDVPVALAIGVAYASSVWATLTGRGEVYFDSVTMFTFFLLGGRFLEMSARHRAGQAAEDLVRLLPAMALRVAADDGETLVPVAELQPGDRVRIRPGDAVPADGRVLEGGSSIDESLLTGESAPLRKAVGDALVGGTVNVESPLLMRVEQVGEDTVLSGIVRLLDRAQTEKPDIARLADRVAGWFVGALLLLAASVAWWWWLHDPADALWVTLSVLVVTCPCALSLATPAAITAATGSLTRLGVLTTRGHALETLARATHLLLDKTGTVTFGRLALEQVLPLAGLPRSRCLALAAALERGSEHPVAQALQGAHRGALPVLTEQQATPGQGIEGSIDGVRWRIGHLDYVEAQCPAGSARERLDELLEGSTVVALGDPRAVQCLFALRDRLRPQAAETVRGLEALGLRVGLLSGDGEGAVGRIARELRIDHAEAGLTPESKLRRLQALQREGAVVAMAGDGVNDAPVLAGAQVSLAMGCGTQLARASADMVLLSEQLPHLLAAVRGARRTLRVVRQNLAWAVVYNAVAVPLAAAGMVTPWMAAIGMATSSLLVVLNALRLARPG